MAPFPCPRQQTSDKAGVGAVVARTCGAYWRRGDAEAMTSASAMLPHVVAMVTFGGVCSWLGYVQFSTGCLCQSDLSCTTQRSLEKEQNHIRCCPCRLQRKRLSDIEVRLVTHMHRTYGLGPKCVAGANKTLDSP